MACYHTINTLERIESFYHIQRFPSIHQYGIKHASADDARCPMAHHKI